MKALSLVAFALLFAPPLMAQTREHTALFSPYAGEQDREIASLSPGDLNELRQGKGWGLARAAELNGLPGPAHLLEMREEIALTPSQVDAIISLRNRMRADAIEAGERLIEAERMLDLAFTNAVPDAAELLRQVTIAGEARAALRLVHLSAHLETPAILSMAQIEKYNVLRGYSNDPCTTTPEGHDPAMWRRHNTCD